MAKKTVKDINVKGKKVLVRVDFNVPLDGKTGAITDDSRIKAVLPTIKYLISRGAKVILCSHLGRPKSEVVEGLRLAPVGERLSQLLEKPVICAKDCIGPEAKRVTEELKGGEVLLLENLRFHPEEERNDPEFAKALAQLAEVFVNDAFGAAHRAHTSTVGLTQYLPAVAGFLMEKEIEFLGKALADPVRPFAMLIGGAKVADKISLLENISERVDSLIIGGSMANTFLKAQGHKVGRSKTEDDQLDFARGLMEKAVARGVRLSLPSDAVITEEFRAESPFKTVPVSEIPDHWQIMDIGLESIERFGAELKQCKTIIWNGPMGVFEFPPFSYGTRALASVLAELDAITIIGGGSTAEVVVELGLEDKLTWVSTGGGASLRFLEGKTLPGVAALMDR